MKKTLIALTLVVAFATSSFSAVSFLVAPGVGEGKIALLGLYGTNHNGAVINSDQNNWSDTNNMGLRVAYGLMDNLDLLAAYTMDSMPNIKNFEDMQPVTGIKQVSGNTSGLGLKYSLSKAGAEVMGYAIPVDCAVAVGYENSVASIKADGSPTVGMGMTSYSIGAVFSKQVDNMMPYGAIALKNLWQNTGNNRLELLDGKALAYNIGIMYGIAKDMAICAEYNLENQMWNEMTTKKGKKVDDASTTSVSGISLGFVYKI
jgi:long-subunit fatty acid transport protein